MGSGTQHWYSNQHLPERLGVPGFIRGRRYVRAAFTEGMIHKYFTVEATQAKSRTEEKRASGGEEAMAGWLVLVDGERPSAFAAAQEELLGSNGLHANGALDRVSFKEYQLMLCLDWPNHTLL